MGYSPTKADPDFWIKSCGTHYEYIATYVDNVLCFSKDPMATIKELQCNYILKGIGKPVYYLGCNICKMGTNWQKENVSAAMSAETYIRNSVSKHKLLFDGLLQEFKSPMDSNYHPELDKSALLNGQQASIFRGLVGSANWAVTIGRYDINYAVNALSRFAMAP